MRFQKGFSLLEVLIAFVILVIGILGASTLIIRSSQMNVKAYETEQIALLANTYVEKIRANSYAIDTYIAGTASEACKNNNVCGAEDRAKTDSYRFGNQLKNAGFDGATYNVSEIEGTNALLGGNNNKAYQLKVEWSKDTDNKYVVNFVIKVK